MADATKGDEMENSQRFDRIDQRFDQVDQRFDRMDSRFDGLEQRFDRLEVRVDGLEQRFDGLERRVDRVEHRLEGVEHRLGGVEQRLDGVEVKVEALGHDVAHRIRVLSEDNKAEFKKIAELIVGRAESIERSLVQRDERWSQELDPIKRALADHARRLAALERKGPKPGR